MISSSCSICEHLPLFILPITYKIVNNLPGSAVQATDVEEFKRLITDYYS